MKSLPCSCKGGDWSKQLKHPLSDELVLIYCDHDYTYYSFDCRSSNMKFVLLNPQNLSSLALFYMLLVIWHIIFHNQIWQFQFTVAVRIYFLKHPILFSNLNLPSLLYEKSKQNYMFYNKSFCWLWIRNFLEFIDFVPVWNQNEIVFIYMHLPQMGLIINKKIHWNIITCLTLLNTQQN